MKPAFFVVLTVLLIGFTARQTASQHQRVDHTWDREAAATYLDERMDVWFANAKRLRTGQGVTSCVSCHTTIPYALARPVLRQAMQVTAPTPQEIRMLDEVTRRVNTYDTHELLYEINDGKKAESRGTEAVLNALILATADAAQHRREASEPTRKAFERLWETQRPDGAWNWLDFGLEPFETVDAVYHGATFAALAVGTAPGGPGGLTSAAKAGIDRLRGYLQTNYATERLYNRTWLLLASTRLKELVPPNQREALIAEIEHRQHDDGGWSLEALGPWRWSKRAAPFKAPGTPDPSLLAGSDAFATGLIVYTLLESGIPADRPAVRKGLEWLRANQRDVQVGERTWRSWRAHSLNVDREHGGPQGEPWRRMFMSDEATAFASLALIASE